MTRKPKPISPKQAKLYVSRHGLYCPHCGSSDVESDPLDVDGPTATASCSCGSCGEEWVDIYTLTSVEAADEFILIDPDDEDKEAEDDAAS